MTPVRSLGRPCTVAPNDKDESGESGQSSIEFALVLPVLLMVLLAFAQVAMVILSHLSVTHAAREVARAVAIDPEVSGVEVAKAAMPGRGTGVDVRVERRPAPGDRELLTVTVTTTVPQITGVGWALPATVSATVVTLREH